MVVYVTDGVATEREIQLGMAGLGRMGANMVRRHMQADTRVCGLLCVVVRSYSAWRRRCHRCRCRRAAVHLNL